MVQVELRSHEQAQLEEMLPHLRDMYEQQRFDEGVEEVETMIGEVETGTPDMDADHWRTLMLGLSSEYVKEKQGAMGTLRPWWLTKKIARRLNEKDAFENEDE